MQTFRRFHYEQPDELPPKFGYDIRTQKSFITEFLTEFSDVGDTIFDPFAGFGTTLLVAEERGRIPYGIEYETERTEYIAHGGVRKQGHTPIARRKNRDGTFATNQNELTKLGVSQYLDYAAIGN